MRSYRWGFVVAAVVMAVACGDEEHDAAPETVAAAPTGEYVTVNAVEVPAIVEATGVAEPFLESTLSTKLMGTVLAVHVREGDRVRAGDVLVELDARDLDAKAAQVAATLAAGNAGLTEATVHAERMRMLYAEDAAPKAQLDAAETGLLRARAGVEAAQASAAELNAVRDYSTVRAPFDGVVVRRLADPGAFAAPGTPLLVVQDSRRLRVSVTAAPGAVRDLRRGDIVTATIEGVPASATVEGVVPAAGTLYTVNAIVDNGAGAHLAGSSAALALPTGVRTALFLPVDAVHRQGDLTGVWVHAGPVPTLRWIRLGDWVDETVEVLAGLRDGDRVLVPGALAGAD
jgi:RND family efflux transporter MFP subunit